MKLYFALLFVIVSLGLIGNSQGDYANDNNKTAEFCTWLKQNYGYACDGPIERWLWQKYQQLVNGVRNCNEFCIKVHNRSGGKCVPGAVDRSTWCPYGQQCDCF